MGNTEPDDIDRDPLRRSAIDAAYSPKVQLDNHILEVDEELIEAYRGTESLPFEPGLYKRIAVKVVDDRGNESLRLLTVGD